jgi:RND family efflux transporter MFP subunit
MFRCLPRETTHRCIPALLLVSLFVLGCGTSGPSGRAGNGKPMKPPVVIVSKPIREDITDYEDFSGRMEAYRTVELKARVTGYLMARHFEDGEEVKEGKLLFEIDPLPLKAALTQSEATLRQAIAHLHRLELDFERAEGLLRKRSISKEDYDKIAGDRDEAEAAVGVARANRQLARINLNYAQIRAPFNGRISRRMIDEGNLVKADETPLTTIVYRDKLYAYFDVDERTFIRLCKLVRLGKIQRAMVMLSLCRWPVGAAINIAGMGAAAVGALDESPKDKRSPILIGLADEKGHSLRGKLDFEDNRLDIGTGTYRMRAVVDNADHFLSPGMYVRVRLPIGQPHNALLIAEQAIGTDQGKKFVYVITPENKAEYREVQVGKLQNGLREITGWELKANEPVVVRGLQKVRRDSEVTPKFVPMKLAASKAKKLDAAEPSLKEKKK